MENLYTPIFDATTFDNQQAPARKNLVKSTLNALMSLVVFVAVVLFFGNQAKGQTYLATESFDLATFPPTGWTNFLTSGTNTWTRVTSGTSPTCATQSGAGMAKFNSFNANGGLDH